MYSAIKQNCDALRHKANQQGFSEEQLEKGHYRLWTPDGKDFVVAPSAPSKQSSYRELSLALRRKGFAD
jgi:hypothetical protein